MFFGNPLVQMKKTWLAYWQAQYGKWKRQILGKTDDSTIAIVTCVQRLHTGGSVAQWPPSSTPKKTWDGRGCRKSIIISRLLTVTPWYQAFAGIVPSAFTIVAEHSWVCSESDPVNRIVGRRVCWSLQVPRHFWESFPTYTNRHTDIRMMAFLTLIDIWQTKRWHLGTTATGDVQALRPGPCSTWGSSTPRHCKQLGSRTPRSKAPGLP